MLVYFYVYVYNKSVCISKSDGIYFCNRFFVVCVVYESIN